MRARAKLLVWAAAFFLFGMAGQGNAATAGAATTCKLGAFVTGLHDFDNSAGTFKADMWLWSVCPTKDVTPLKTMEFTSAVTTQASLDATLQRGNLWWSTRKVTGVFRQQASLQNYPFDRSPLLITMEEGVMDATELRYAADIANSKLDPAVSISGWSLNGFHIESGIVSHPTTYGDPSLPNGHSDYAQLTVRVDAERAHWPNFIKATLPLYIACFLVLIILTFDVVDNNLARMSTFASTMFAVVLSYLSIDRFVGTHQELYLLDQLHMIGLALILSATAWTVGAHIEVMRLHNEATLRRWDFRVSTALQIAYLLANVVVVWWAIAHGAA